jgi:predicted dehydrogenase
VGGGRIVGEGCHFVDLLRFLVGFKIIDSSICKMEGSTSDTVIITLNFEDGSVGTIQYFSNGSKTFPKERLEVFADGSILQLDNYRKLIGFGWPRFGKMNLKRQDKGQNGCAKSFVDVLNNGGMPPIPIEEILEVSRIVIELSDMLRSKK